VYDKWDDVICPETSVYVWSKFTGGRHIDLRNLGPEAEEDEAWYDIRRAEDPMQRTRDLVPDKHDLDAFTLERMLGKPDKATSRRK
jgi:hypothetical protein